jgi:hypothetical protein
MYDLKVSKLIFQLQNDESTRQKPLKLMSNLTYRSPKISNLRS